LHIREERGEQDHKGGNTKKTKRKPKLGTKAKELVVMTKRSCSHEEKCQEPKKIAQLKKKAMMMKKVMMIIIALASYTQERAKGSKTMGGNTKKQVQAKNQEQNHKNV